MAQDQCVHCFLPKNSQRQLKQTGTSSPETDNFLRSLSMDHSLLGAQALGQ